MKTSSKKYLNILWAVDILATEKKAKSSANTMLKILSKITRVKIHPTYVVRFSEQAQPLSRGEGGKALVKNVEEAMKRWLIGVKLPLEKPKALLQEGIYLRADVDALITEAKKIKADVILVNTHARKGFTRLWMGSFAETLMHHSPVPVLFLNPSSKMEGKIKTILFPTNLSPDSQKALRYVGQLASQLKAQVVLYNNVEFFVGSPGLALTEMADFNQIREKDVKERRKTLEKWAARLERQNGIKTTVIVDESDVRVVDGIRRISQKQPSCVIAMAAQTGPALSVLVGSTTRKVVRESEVPVLAFH